MVDLTRDSNLTHAGVVALERIGDRQFVQQWANDKSAAVRMAVLLVRRRWSDPRIAQFMDDAQLEIVTETSRSINQSVNGVRSRITVFQATSDFQY
ncbi:MAG: hypothetical protein GY903_27550 [Fuerstiella sp.]|nr:hypothetical protein [Fuerstiella sp.]